MAALKPPANNGFSLLELLISIALLAVGIITVMQALSFSAGAAAFSRQSLAASALVKDRLWLLEFKEKNGILEATTGGSVEKNGIFSLTQSLTGDEARALYRADLTLEWQRKSRFEKMDAHTYLRTD